MRESFPRNDLVIFGACVTMAAAACLLPAPPSHAPGLALAGFTLPSTCLLHLATGSDCPLCGLTRSLVCLGHGRLMDAAAFHPLGPALAVFVLLQLCYRAGRLILGPGWLPLANLSSHVRLAPFYLLIAALLAAWFIKLALLAATAVPL